MAMPSAPRHSAGFWRRLRDAALFASIVLSGQASAQLNNDTSPTSLFKSRPDLHPPIIDFTVLRPELVLPGYIFIAPYRNLDPGPYIYDNWGNLIWSGAGHSGPKTAHTPRVCQYKGEDHICYFEGKQHQGFARGHGVIMNKHYQIVQTIEASGAGASSDMHEFKLTPYSNGTTALMTVYQPRQYDLSTNPRFNVRNGMGWIVEGVFQEVEIGTGRVVFEWRSLDHVDPGESWTMPGTTDTSGNGLRESTPWDYFHLNSIDKNADGDYLLSARHVGAIYKVSGENGSIMWQLGGANPSFKQLDFIFSYQHHARWVSENGTHTRISFYDNASNSFNHTGRHSHGWIIEIDHEAGTARKVQEWGAPEPAGGLLSGSQGNMQLLPHGGVHIGWGEHAFFSEHTADGTAVQYGKLASRPSNVMIYRSNKYNWTGEPLTKPALWTYSKMGKDRMVFFVSWNGATEVKKWDFYTGPSANGPWSLAGSKMKSGFETVMHTTGNVSTWAYAAALDAHGAVLQNSVVARTFVPSPSLRRFCGNDGCDPSVPVEGEDRVPYETDVNISPALLSTNRGYDTSHYYMDAAAATEVGADTPWNEWSGTTMPPADTRPAASGSSAQCKSFSATAAGVVAAGAESSLASSLFLLFLGALLGLLSSMFLGFLRRGGVALRKPLEYLSILTGGGAGSSGVWSRYARLREKDYDLADGADEGLVAGASGSRDRY